MTEEIQDSPENTANSVVETDPHAAYFAEQKRVIEDILKDATDKVDAFQNRMDECDKFVFHENNGVPALYDALEAAKELYEKLIGYTEEQKEQSASNAIEKLRATASDKLKAIQEYHEILFADSQDGTTKSIENQIEELQHSVASLLDTLQSERNAFAQYREDAEKQTQLKIQAIEKLLPEASAGGLVDSLEKGGNLYNNGWVKAGHYILFLAPLCVLALLNACPEKFEALKIISDKFEKGDIAIENFLLGKVLLSTPFLLLSYFGFSSLRLGRKLFEEYHHKQRIMQLYRGFRKEFEDNFGSIDEADEKTKTLLQKFFNLMLDAIERSPSDAMKDHDRGAFSEVFGLLLAQKVSEKAAPKQTEAS